MRITALLYIIFGLLSFSFAKDPGKATFSSIGGWKVKVLAKELAVPTALSGNQLLRIHGSKIDVTFVSKSEPPISIGSIKKRIKTLKGDKKSLKVHKTKKGAVFSFRSNNHVHWFSTKGGYLSASSDKLTKKTYSSLLKRVSKDNL